MFDRDPLEQFLIGHRHACDLHALLLDIEQRLEHLAVHRTQYRHDEIGDHLLPHDLKHACIAA